MSEKGGFKVTNISENGNTGLFWLGKDNLSVYDVVRILNELLEENEQLKKKILEEIDLEVAYVDETYSDGRMSKEQHNGAIISLRQLREKFE